MFKKLVLSVAATAFAGSAMAGQWVFDDPYWKQELMEKSASVSVASGSLDIFGRPIVELTGLEGFGRFEPLPQFAIKARDTGVSYAAAGTTMRDAGTDDSPSRISGAEIVEGHKAERQALEGAGFPQYSN